MAASRLEFRILGPLAVQVDGAPVAIGGPKQRALLALLLLSANRVVPRERLIEELFAEQSVNSADHALRNHVSRLRKVLVPAVRDGSRLVARPPGYVLRVEPGELDLESFELLVTAGHESLEASDPAAAAESLRAAERLWQGRPLADLELEPFARIEVERLEELRLAAVEERVDAELALGGHRTLIPELETLSSEHPYRERFRAQLMLALYRSGRQAEGLAVYRRTRDLLNDELGLEPGVELRELEQAILVQDPTLAPPQDGRRPRVAPLLDVCPFKGLAPFGADDTELFFGRERLVDELVARLTDQQLLAVVGPSGSGKTSLLRAGLAAHLPPNRELCRPSRRTAADLHAAVESVPPGQRVVLVVDQLEELFAGSFADEDRRAFVDAIVEATWDTERRAVVLIGLRADFFGHLASYGELAELVGSNHVLLGPMSPHELRRAIEGPAERTGLEVEPALVDALVDDVAGEPGGLPLLSTALLDLWQERDGRALTLAAYERRGGVRAAVARHAESAFRSLGEEDQQVARRTLLRLVDGGDGEAFTRRRVARDELDADDERVPRVVSALVGSRLLVADEGTVELVHEALVDGWPRLVDWLEDDAAGRRVRRHLTRAASEWERGGRDESELYRGARLAATLDWASSTDGKAGLNRLEREFLKQSRTAFDRANRNLRAVLAVVILLLVGALAAGAIALVARGSARQQATVAVAQRLGAQALVEPRLDRALLLAREGVHLDDSVATRSNLLATLLKSPAALAVLHGGGARVLDDARSPDGRMLVVRGDDGSVTFFDTRNLRALGPRFNSSGQISYFGAIVRPVRALAFSPDGRTLAVGDSDGDHATLALLDARTHLPRASVTSPANAVTADVAYAPDGRTLVTGEAVSGRWRAPAEVLVTRRAVDGRELVRSAPIAAGRLIGFADRGRYLLVTSGEETSYLLDPRSLARARAFHVGGTAALAPAGRLAAFGHDDGGIEVLDLRTGAARPMKHPATGRVLGLAFSQDGKVLASASDDGSVAVWDVRTRTLRETFTGHAAAALGLLFGRGQTTLYSGSNDGSVIVWDIRGDRRLGRPFRFAPVPAAGVGPRDPTPNASTALAVSPDGALFVTSPGPGRVTLWRTRDLADLGELDGPTGHVNSLAWSRDGRFLAGAGDSGRTVVWDVAERTIARLLGPSGSGGLSGVAFSPDGEHVATAGIDGTLGVYDVLTGRRVGSARVKGSLQDVDFSPDGGRVAAGSLAGEIVIWEVAQRELERRIHAESALAPIGFSPDGATIATGDSTGRVSFWDAATGRRAGRSLGGQNGWVGSLAFQPGGDELVSSSADGKLRLWDLAAGKLVGSPIPGGDAGGSVTFVPSGEEIIAVFGSGTGIVWNVEPAAWEAQACRVANRNLSPSEWGDFLPGHRYGDVCP